MTSRKCSYPDWEGNITVGEHLFGKDNVCIVCGESKENIMSQDDKLKMAAAMKRYGGSFVQALSECFILADSDNLQRLCNAFPEYIEKYSCVAAPPYALEAWS